MTSSVETMTTAMETMKKKLFKIAMKGEWDEVVNIYKNDQAAYKAKITRSGDTALHIAVSDGREDIVEKLVELIRKTDESKKTLKVGNELQNTPLHLAASMGNVRMCECITKENSKLVGARNNDGETPFFLAALHGKKDAFLCLHNKCEASKGYSYCRRKDGETILHCAIAGDYFDLAYQIILLYEDLVNSVNEQGITPLHLLASKPSAFESGSHHSWLSKLIYHCIFVDELKEDPSLKASRDEKKPKYPENYRTCITFFQLLLNMILVIVRRDTQKRGGKANAENAGSGLQETSKKDGDAEDPRPEHGGIGIIQLPKKENMGSLWPWFPARSYSGDHQCKQTPSKKCISSSAAPPKPHWRGTSALGYQSTNGPQGRQLFPSNYVTCFDSIKLVSKAMLVILGLGSMAIRKLQNKKEKHTWSVQIMNELLRCTSMYEYENDGTNPLQSPVPFPTEDHQTEPYTTISEVASTAISSETQKEDQNKGNEGKDKKGEGEKKSLDRTKRETAILIAAKNGITEMVEKILELFPVAIHDMNSDKKNIVLLAVENRQPHVYELLLKRNIFKDNVFRKVDNKGNSALHLAAMQGEYRPWLIPGAALQMQWEIKWYEFVKTSMPAHFFVHYNKDGKTPKNIFTDTHKDLVENGGKWLTNTSESCSVVAALIATVAFATSATVPGGINEDSGSPTLEDQPAFNVFAISSLVALCFSVTAVVMFLAILTSRYQEKDFGKDLPRKLLLGLTSLFVSIASILISFCAGHFFVIRDKLKYAAFPIYAVTCLPVTFFAIAQFPLYFDLIWATFKMVPQRSYQVVAP